MLPRVSLSRLLAVVAFFGVAFAALRLATPVLASAVYSLAVLVLATALLRGIARREMGWTGFGLFGLVYLHFSLFASPPLLTGYFLESFGSGILGFSTNMTFFSPYSSALLPPDSSRLHVAHSLLAVLFGFMGAMLGRFFAVRSEAAR